jgi:hypothetical protein
LYIHAKRQLSHFSLFFFGIQFQDLRARAGGCRGPIISSSPTSWPKPRDGSVSIFAIAVRAVLQPYPTSFTKNFRPSPSSAKDGKFQRIALSTLPYFARIVTRLIDDTYFKISNLPRVEKTWPDGSDAVDVNIDSCVETNANTQETDACRVDIPTYLPRA